MAEAVITISITVAETTPPALPKRRSLLLRAALIGIGIGMLLGTITHPPKARLLWNASPSAPIGLYLVTPGAPLEVGDMVAARAPESVRQLATMRGYLPLGVPL